MYPRLNIVAERRAAPLRARLASHAAQTHPLTQRGKLATQRGAGYLARQETAQTDRERRGHER